ncbi:hypothetical protein CDV31_010077 [Fusarium ambrosium]|uniref:Uncharacterized protein n=1 Tax=Fusarium ambrosium TaxID=131363 RepID=A0A428TQT9_9HYPO|nr:hypothetical protein CDV31_010077 [Fusarium ambrosium]
MPRPKQPSRIIDDLRIVTLERDNAQDAVDKIISDLVSTEAELEDAKRDVADQKAENSKLQHQLARFLSQESHVQQQTDLIDLSSDTQQRLPARGSDCGGLRYRPPQVRHLELEAQIKSKDEALEQKNRELKEKDAMIAELKQRKRVQRVLDGQGGFFGVDTCPDCYCRKRKSSRAKSN